MNPSRIKITHAYGEVSPNVWSDFDWVRENHAWLLESYGRCVILVYEKQVVGTGKTLDEAVADAESRLPPEIQQITPVTEYLAPRHRLRFVRSVVKSSEDN